MVSMIATILGGVGLFLLGMILLTDGLKALAGDSLRGFLARFTGGRFSSMAAGAGITTVVQSSSATTLATIGFVSAGLLTFHQAVGILLGANLGTTSTGWLLSVLGLEFSISKVALPLIGVGALTRLLTRDRLAHVGLAIAGFGLIFVGIDTLQAGMETLSTRIDPSSFPQAGLSGRLLLVLVGVVMTVVMQSSSAAVATTLTALHTGTIDLTQAAALVVGQNVGTTVTAGIAAIGASVPAKRTALAHVLFNVITGLLAFMVLPLAVWLLETGARAIDVTAPALLLAGFHTAFNLLGVLVFLPLLNPFSTLVTRLLPDRGPRLTRFLGPVVARGPVAIDAAGLTLRATLEEALEVLLALLTPDGSRQASLERLQAVEDALLETREFLGQIRNGSPSEGHYERHLALLHVLDHLERLTEACREKTFLTQVGDHPDVAAVVGALQQQAKMALEAIRQDAPIPRGALEQEAKQIAEIRKRSRPRLLMSAAEGDLAPARGSKILETVRWVDRLAFHLWRAGHHLFRGDPTSIPDAVLPPEDGENEDGADTTASAEDAPSTLHAGGTA
jgi:phosphate:Na+ symporter